jgi:phosphate-selective porin OprO and OprP
MLRFRLAVIPLFLLILLSAGRLAAQLSEPANQMSSTPLPAKNYLLPDIPAKWLTYNGRLFSIKVSVAVLYDYTFLDQNAASREQVGVQNDAADLRAGRLMFSGQIKFRRPWSYVIAGDYNEVREPEDRLFDGLDAYVTIPLWGDARISIGKQKEPFIYEMVGDAANLPQQERMLSPFFVSRSVGVKVTDTALNERMTWSAGWFNDWLVNDLSFKTSGNDFAARVTGLPVLSEDGARYLHLAIGARYTGARRGMLRLKGRPESNITNNYVDTGEFPGRAVRTLGLELLWTDGPFSVLAEIDPAWADASKVGSPRFLGSSLVISYVLTGEHRPYDRKTGYARRIMPRSRFGAWEVFGRYASADLMDRAINGGDLSKWTVGLNWWATRQWKFSVGAGPANLDRAGRRDGRTTITLLRAQWIF